MTESTRSEPLLQHPQANCQLVLDGQDIGYRLQRSHRRTLGMRITEDGLAVSAPFWITRGQVEHVLLSRAGWILRKLAEAYRRRGVRDVTLRIFPGARHELINETNRDEAIAEIVTWMLDRFPADG